MKGQGKRCYENRMSAGWVEVLRPSGLVRPVSKEKKRARIVPRMLPLKREA